MQKCEVTRHLFRFSKLMQSLSGAIILNDTYVVPNDEKVVKITILHSFDVNPAVRLIKQVVFAALCLLLIKIYLCCLIF